MRFLRRFQALLFFGIAFAVLLRANFTEALAQTSMNMLRQVNGAFSGRIGSLILHNGKMFVVVSNAAPIRQHSMQGTGQISQNGIYVSADAGASWTALGSFPETAEVSRLFSYRNFLFATTLSDGQILYRSSNDGASWQPVSTRQMGALTHLAEIGDTLFARAGDSRLSTMYHSLDSGSTWRFLTAPGSIGSVVGVLHQNRNNQTRTLLFGGSPNGILRSVDAGLRWDPVPSSPEIRNVVVNQALSVDSAGLYLATNLGIYRSTDDGLSWALLGRELEGRSVTAVLPFAQNLIAATNDGLYLFNGTGWNQISITTTLGERLQIVVESLVKSSDNRDVVIGTNLGLLSARVVSGNSLGNTQGNTLDTAWNLLSRGLPMSSVEKNGFARLGTMLFAANAGRGLIRSLTGETWFLQPSTFNTGSDGSAGVNVVAASPENQTIIIANSVGTFVSNTAGTAWRQVFVGSASDPVTSAFAGRNGLFLLGTRSGFIFRATTSNALSWLRVPQNPLENSNTAINCFFGINNLLFAGTEQGLMRSLDGGSTWLKIAENRFPPIAVNDLALGANSTLAAATSQGIFRSFDNGQTWLPPSANALQDTVYALANINALWYAGTAQNGVFRSQDNGLSWIKLPLDPIQTVSAFMQDSTRLFIGTNRGIYEYGLPPAEDFPVIVSLIGADSLFLGLSEAVITLVGQNFSTNAQVRIDGTNARILSQSAGRITLSVPENIFRTLGLKTLALLNSSTARTNTSLNVQALPADFPNVSLQPQALEPFVAFLTQVSDVKSYDVRAANLRDSLILQVPSGFELSENQGTVWRNRLAFAPQNRTLTQRVLVRFRPESLQSTGGSISHRQGSFSLASMPLSGTVRSLQIEVSTGINEEFGATKVGQSIRRTISIRNPNNISITLATMLLGRDVRDFSLSAAEVVLPPQSTANLDVIFTPQSRGTKQATVGLLGLAGAEISLQGRGVQAVFEFSPSTITLSEQAFVGQTSNVPRANVRITNLGDAEDIVQGFQSDSREFRLLNLQNSAVEPGTSFDAVLEFMPESEGVKISRIRLLTANRFSTSSVLQVQAGAILLQAPERRFPENGAVLSNTQIPLQWDSAAFATHYQVVFSEISSPNLFAQTPAITRSTGLSVSVRQNQTYYWSVRSLILRGNDTLVRSAWQQRGFFTTNTSTAVSLPPLLDFGQISTEQIISAPRSLGLTARSGTWRIQQISAVLGIDNGDTSNFAFTNLTSLIGQRVRPIAAPHPIAAVFSPSSVRGRPFQALFEMRLQNAASGEALVLPFTMRAIAISCASVTIGVNQGCAETMLQIEVLPRKTSYLAGEDVRLQIRLNDVRSANPALERFFTRLNLSLELSNITLLSFANTLTNGIGTASDNRSRVIYYDDYFVNPNSQTGNVGGRIDMTLERAQNLRSGVLAELQGKAVIGSKGIAATSQESLETLQIRLTNAVWTNERGENLETGQILLWNGQRGRTLADVAVPVTVNTCRVTGGSLTLALTTSLAMRGTIPNPASDKVSLVFSLEERALTELFLINAFGTPMKTVFFEEKMPGTYQLDIPISDLPSGSYFWILRTGFERIQQRMEVVR